MLKILFSYFSYIDTVRDVLVGHTNRIIEQLIQRSGREMDQFCFGSAYLQLNPNYRRLERMEPLTWRKEGISNHWAGPRGLRKSCCKICCADKLCGGCKDCLCKHGPVRGGYDGLVVLAAITRDSVAKSISGNTILDPEDFSLALEFSLTLHYLQTDSRIVYSSREKFTNEHNPKLGKVKKHPAYCIYLAYRLDTSLSTPTISDLESITVGKGVEGVAGGVLEDLEENEDTLEVLEELENKNLVNRLTHMEQENKELREKVSKLERGRGWLEERLVALESKMSKMSPEEKSGITTTEITQK
ncbi:uncharacterized protein LOC111697665 [Eurytemora carolleeae]|uniref:uncharacterized protein LOC111697665 n=1 Tax=Eurytemora carolleeae TaxID=1294199 RepID=UPI000C778DD1|nr:uncharacterized protein LOC111697665 [Eurytemora carolleeae]|eukprot:XP_023323509.1 uncharacterized protein LOC111697665 [Eurytemora affinis]